MSNKKYYVKKHYKKAKYDCIYNLNHVCYNKKKVYEKKCLGSNQCGFYQNSFRGQFTYELKKYNQGFLLIIRIPYISFDSFLDTSDGYVLNYRQYVPFTLFVNLKVFNIEAYNKFASNDFDKNINLKNNMLSIFFYNPVEIVKIQDKSYSELKENIVLNYSTSNHCGKVQVKLYIPKEQLFRMFENCFSPNKSIEDKKMEKAKENATAESFVKTSFGQDFSNKSRVSIPVHDYVKAIVLNDVRLCTEKNHSVIDVKAKVRIAQPDSKIIDYWLPAAYCEKCNTYYVLKDDFRNAKRRGVILCQIEDKTYDYIKKLSQKSYVGGESRVHKMGYNVKKNNGLTRKQRQLILANIIENTDISKHEIKSIIIRCICQHQAQENYSQSVSCWREDLEFINSYQLGDMPEVKLKEIVVKGKKIPDDMKSEM